MAYLSDTPLEEEDPWFKAEKIPEESTEEILANLFDRALEQLLDFTTLALTKENPLAVLPFQGEGATAEYFTEHFTLAAAMSDRITLAERKDIAQILEEQVFQSSGLTEEEKVSAIGNLLNAEILVSGSLFQKDRDYELFLKLLRTETGEVLAVTRAVIDGNLGLR